MPIHNLTDLTIRLADENDQVYKTFEPAGHTLKLRTRGEEREIDGVKVDITFVTGIEGLPEPEEGTFYIVPQPVMYVLNRPDLILPDTGPSAILDENQKVYAVRRLYSVSREGGA